MRMSMQYEKSPDNALVGEYERGKAGVVRKHGPSLPGPGLGPGR